MNRLYRVAGISKQAHHQQLRRDALLSLEIEELIVHIDLIRSEHPGCGLEKLYYTLAPTCMGRDQFIDTFMALGYRVQYRRNYRRTTFAAGNHFPDLIAGALVRSACRVWQTDITYFDANNRFYYLVFIIDIYTKLIVGYCASEHMRAQANIDALKMALHAQKNTQGLIHHSDRGSQYSSKIYLQLLAVHEIIPSMAQMAQENAYAERINGTIKNEYLNYKNIKDIKSLKKEVKAAVKHYNEKRLHNALPERTTPANFAKQLVHLSDQQRPMVIVYAKENYKLRQTSSLNQFRPTTNLLDHVCPMNNV
mgnify:CR=1 FL=1|jgi:putative transposase